MLSGVYLKCRSDGHSDWDICDKFATEDYVGSSRAIIAVDPGGGLILAKRHLPSCSTIRLISSLCSIPKDPNEGIIDYCGSSIALI
jgi:hypothetical protein